MVKPKITIATSEENMEEVKKAFEESGLGDVAIVELKPFEVEPKDRERLEATWQNTNM